MTVSAHYPDRYMASPLQNIPQFMRASMPRIQSSGSGARECDDPTDLRIIVR